MFEIFQTDEAKAQLNLLKKDKGLKKRYKAVVKTIKLLSQNPRHPGLHTHKYIPLSEAYAESSTPAAYRIFWCYGVEKKQITIISITPHP